MVFKATINQSQVHVTLVHATIPKTIALKACTHSSLSLWSRGNNNYDTQDRTPFHLFFTLTTLVVVLKKKTVQYKDKIYANFYCKFKLYFFKKTCLK